MRTLVTGAAGMMGRSVADQLSACGHDVYQTDAEDMDVRMPAQVRSVFERVRPELVFHLAALTDVDRCETDPDEAFRTNTIGVQNVALGCRMVKAPIVYVSTLSVFDGRKTEPYTEFDSPSPQSVYSRSKYEGEQLIKDLVPCHYIVRPGWVFGGGAADKKFVPKIIGWARSMAELGVSDDTYGSPTYTDDIARCMVSLSETGLYGTYHSVNTGPACSRFEFARKILEFAEIKTCRLFPTVSASLQQAAPRPRMEAGRNLHMELLGLDWMRPWTDALKVYIQTRTRDHSR